MKPKRLTVWLDEEPHQKLKQQADKELRSVAAQARLLLTTAIAQSRTKRRPALVEGEAA